MNNNDPLALANNNMLTKPTVFKAAGLGDVTLVGEADSRSGGMGCVYFQKGKAFKIYHDPDDAIKKKMPERLQSLTKLDHNGIVGPKGLVYDQKGNFVGYWMPTVQGEELTRLLTMQYQQSKGIGIPELVKFLEKKREVMLYAHDRGVIVGDPNERNGMFRKMPNGLFCFHLDVDNWGIDKLQPMAVAPHIQDHQHKGKLNSLTDWYGEGVVWFWLMHLDHPYGGRLKGFSHHDPEHWINRMKAGASIFAPGVKITGAVRDFSELPAQFVEWCGRVYQDGERSIPPSLTAPTILPAAATTMIKTVGTSGAVTLTKLFDKAGDPVMRVFRCNLVLTKSGKLYNLETGSFVYQVKSPACEVVRNGEHFLIGDYEGDSLEFVCVKISDGTVLQISNKFAGKQIWVRDDRMYVIAESHIVELKLWLMGDNPPLLAAAKNWTIAPNTMTWLNEVAVQNIFGQAYVWVPFAAGTYAVLRVAELDGLSLVSSHANGKNAIITAQGKNGQSVKVEIKFATGFSSCEVKTGKIQSPALNLTMLDKGMVAQLEDDGEINFYFPFTDKSKLVKDGNISTRMQLQSVGDKVLYLNNGAVWHLKAV